MMLWRGSLITKYMGADLYRSFKSGEKKGAKVPILGFERSDRAVNVGYFRDPYNSGSVLNMYGLSWWQHVVPMQDKEGILATAKVKKLRSMLDDELLEKNLTTAEWYGGKKFDEKDKEDIRDGARLLRKFLDECVKDKDTIEASL